MGLLSFLGDIFKPATELIDELHTSDEEKFKLRNEFAKAQIEAQSQLLKYETRLVEAKSATIVAEAKSGHFITSAWRPITMLCFTGIVVARWFGLTSGSISPELELELFGIIKIGLGGYIVGRSGEKIASVLRK